MRQIRKTTTLLALCACLTLSAVALPAKPGPPATAKWWQCQYQIRTLLIVMTFTSAGLGTGHEEERGWQSRIEDNARGSDGRHLDYEKYANLEDLRTDMHKFAAGLRQSAEYTPSNLGTFQFILRNAAAKDPAIRKKIAEFGTPLDDADKLKTHIQRNEAFFLGIGQGYRSPFERTRQENVDEVLVDIVDGLRKETGGEELIVDWRKLRKGIENRGYYHYAGHIVSTILDQPVTLTSGGIEFTHYHAMLYGPLRDLTAASENDPAIATRLWHHTQGVLKAQKRSEWMKQVLENTRFPKTEKEFQKFATFQVSFWQDWESFTSQLLADQISTMAANGTLQGTTYRQLLEKTFGPDILLHPSAGEPSRK